MSDAAILTTQVKSTSNNGENYGTGTGKAVTPSSPQRFPTPATRGTHEATKHTITAHYN